MSRRTKIFQHSYLLWNWDALVKNTRARLRGSGAVFPRHEHQAIALLIWFFDPDLKKQVLDASKSAQVMRLELAQLVSEYPEYTIAAIQSIRNKRNAKRTKSSMVREILLTRREVQDETGNWVPATEALAKHVADAVIRGCVVTAAGQEQVFARFCGEKRGVFVKRS